MLRSQAPIVEDVDERFGVGIFFGQDSEGEIFVQSLAPGGSAARARAVKEGDILVKVNHESSNAMTLMQLRSLVMGCQGSTVTLAFQRHTRKGNFFFFDVELVRGGRMYLDLLQRNLELANEKDNLTQLLSFHQSSIDALQAERDRLRNTSLQKDDPHMKQLEEEVRESRQEVASLKTQHANAQGRCAKLKGEIDILLAKVTEQDDAIRHLSTLSKDRLSYVSEVERRRGEERGAWKAVHHKLQEDLQERDNAKRSAQYSLVQALADLQHSKQDVTVLRMRESNVRERMGRGHSVLREALRQNEEVGLDLATLVGEMEVNQQDLMTALLGGRHRIARPEEVSA